VDGCTGAQSRPDETAPVGQDPGQIESVRLDGVGRDRQLPVCPGARRQVAEVAPFEREHPGHELGNRQSREPLRHVGVVARRERQHEPAVDFPDAVPVTEAREGAFVPRLDNVDERVAELLTVGGFK